MSVAMAGQADGAPGARPGLEGPGGWRGDWRHGVRYGALGWPLAFVALPLYVVLPEHYAREFGVPLATLGLLLLATRLADALADPWIGVAVDRLFRVSATRVLVAAALSALVLAAGLRALFFPPMWRGTPLLAWCAMALALTCMAYSVLSVIHQAWGARLGGDEDQRARVVAWREGFGLAGVMTAAVLPSLAGLGATTGAVAAALAMAVALLWCAPRGIGAAAAGPDVDPMLPWRVGAFRRLLAVYLVNGIASAVPATLVLFFIRDRLQAQSHEALFLALYFAAGALSLPLCVRWVSRWGLARTWRAGMALAVLAFAGAAALGPGDVAAYAAICVASGVALGADLALPGALLAGVVQRAGHGGRQEGAYFGWWTFATKLNLALAAGLALPLLSAFGYAPGARAPGSLQALVAAYCLLPCMLKIAAAVLLQLCWIRKDF